MKLSGRLGIEYPSMKKSKPLTSQFSEPIRETRNRRYSFHLLLSLPCQSGFGISERAIEVCRHWSGGTRGRGRQQCPQVIRYCGDLRLGPQRIDRVNKAMAKGEATGYQDYRKILDRKDIDFVTIGTTDHWHTRIAIQAMQAGKDVYCEKPLTLTIEEGKQICKVAKETGRVFQVGTQQRSEMSQRFLTAIGIIREGRIGAIKKVTCNIGSSPTGGPFKKSDPPANLDWNNWLGQAPKVDYIKERAHYLFRWWYEYSGGKMTDWGAHQCRHRPMGLGSKWRRAGGLGTGPYRGRTSDSL